MQPGKPTPQQQLENQLRFTFLVLQHRIEERNWSEALQNSTILSRILIEVQRMTIESMQPQVNPDVKNTEPESQETG